MKNTKIININEKRMEATNKEMKKQNVSHKDIRANFIKMMELNKKMKERGK